jgi:hypothetical protein
MSTPDIISKLGDELGKGITTEVQVVYLLAGIRKLIERDNLEEEYAALNFHCDWVLHSRLDRAGAKTVLRPFDDAHVTMRRHMDLPRDLRAEIDRISKMKTFEQELTKFLATRGLPPLTKLRPDGWVHFLHLYAKVIEDIPLVVKTSPPNEFANITSLTVRCELAGNTVLGLREGHQFYKVVWIIQDKDGECGEIFVINSFEINPEQLAE